MKNIDRKSRFNVLSMIELTMTNGSQRINYVNFYGFVVFKSDTFSIELNIFQYVVGDFD